MMLRTRRTIPPFGFSVAGFGLSIPGTGKSIAGLAPPDAALEKTLDGEKIRRKTPPLYTSLGVCRLNSQPRIIFEEPIRVQNLFLLHSLNPFPRGMVRFQQTFFPDTFGCARLSENKFSLRSRLHESSRHGKAKTSFALLIWLNEIVDLMCIMYHVLRVES